MNYVYLTNDGPLRLGKRDLFNTVLIRLSHDHSWQDGNMSTPFVGVLLSKNLFLDEELIIIEITFRIMLPFFWPQISSVYGITFLRRF